MTDNERKEILSKAKPILFNTEMVRAILDGRKTVTRRVLKNQDSGTFDYDYNYDTDGIARSVDLIYDNGNNGLWTLTNKMPYQIGDILYVRETFCHYEKHHIIDGVQYAYKADATPESERARKDYGYKWHPSIHMPKEAARIFLQVTNVRVERLQDIDDDGVVAEGLEIGAPFDELWDSTIKKSDIDKYGWAANPFVWVIEFERID